MESYGGQKAQLICYDFKILSQIKNNARANSE